MTVVRYILLAVIALCPLTAWAQSFTSQPGAVDGIGNPFPQQPGPGAIVPPGFQNGAEGQIPQNQAALLMQAAGAGQISPYQREIPAQPQVLPAQRRNSSRHYTAPVWQDSAKGGYFGIMGAIAQPGVYFHANQRITLGELLKLAGNSTPAATGGVRIVRQGRGGMQTFLSPESQYEIMSGDVVLLETQRPQSKSGLREYRSTAAGDTAGTPAPKLPTLAYLAFVNLSPQPIIVPVPSDQATLAAVIKWLHQDEKSPPSVRVLAPSPAVRQNFSIPPDQQLLENGTVLVFDSTTIKRERLPPFPPVIGEAAASQAAPAATPPRTTPTQLPDMGQAPRISPAPSQVPQTNPALKPLKAAPPATIPRGPRSADLQNYGPTRPGSAPSDNFRAAPQGPATSGGPLLMMPQSNGPSRSHATAPESNQRPSQPPQRFRAPNNLETTSAEYEALPMSWQPPVGANIGQPELEDQGIVQAHGEANPNQDEFAGPILELPKPVPNLVHPDPVAAPQPASPSTAATGPSSGTSNISLRLVWFSLGSLLMLIGGLWCLSRLDRPRRVRVPVPGGHASRLRNPSPQGHSAAGPQLGLRIVKHTGKALSEVPLPMAPVTRPAPEPVRAKPPVPTPTPGPAHTISQEEQRLRELFQRARASRNAAADPVPSEVPAKPVQPPARPLEKLSPDELRQLSGRRSTPVEKVLAQVPSLKKASSQVVDKPASEPGNLLDRVLRSQQKR